MINLIDRYLLREVIKPFLFCVFALTLVLIGGQLFELTDLIIIQQVPVILVTELLLYRLPGIMVETLSISVLFSCLLTLGHLVQTNEYTAIRMGGYSFKRVLMPFFFISLLVSVLSFTANEYIVPFSTHRSQNIIRRELIKEPGLALQEDLFFTGNGDRFYYIGELNESDQTIKQIVVFFYEEEREFPQLISAPRGTYSDTIWSLEEGIIYKMTPRGHIENEVAFDKLELDVSERIKELYGKQRTPSEMSRTELIHQIELFERSGLSVSSLLVEYYHRYSLPLASFIFVIIGAPLSILSQKGRIFGIVTSLVILFLYYILISVCQSFGSNDLLDPFWAAWLPNIIFVAVGSILIFYQDNLQYKSK